MTHAHHQHLHARRAPEEGLEDYVKRDSQYARAVAQDSEPLLPREATSPDNYGLADGSNSGGSSSSSSSSSTSNNCGSGVGDSTCPATATGTTTIPIVLGVVIPVTFFVIAMIVIWRIKRKRERVEAEADKHASLDFGLGEMKSGDRKKPRLGKKGPPPEMMDINAEKAFRRNRGLSMDMGSPYVLPGELTGSRASFHSMSRSAHDHEDPYRPVGLVRGVSPNSMSRPGSRRDNASVWTESSEKTAYGTRTNLVDHAQRMPLTSPPSPLNTETPLLAHAPSSQLSSPMLSPAVLPGPAPTFSDKPFSRKPVGQAPTTQAPTPPASAQPPQASLLDKQSPIPPQENGFDFNSPRNLPSTATIPTLQFTEPSPAKKLPPPPLTDVSHPFRRENVQQPKAEEPTQEPSPQFEEDYETYADVLGIVQEPADDASYEPQDQGLGVQGVDVGNRRLSATMRPLPPDDPNDNPEVRANRIRSFYKEYFDEKRGTTFTGYGGGVPQYYEDYNQEYLDGATVWDPATGQFVVWGGDRPYAEPVTRRAMTPPPRAPPRFRDGSAGGRMYGSGQYGTPHQRGFSASASGPGTPRGRTPAKRLPPPAPLTNLPTPHMLRDDSAIFNAGDFAPPASWQDRVAGRSQSPSMEKRPYSPNVRAFSPLASSFDDLRVMPSPHALRRSGTFTGLDFAPPPRINHEIGSDAGSIRSGRSMASQQQHLYNIRAGAYRVSRLPHEMVGTKDDLAVALKPSWDQRGHGRI